MPQRTHPFLSLSSKSSGLNLDVSGLGTLWSVPQRGCPSVSRHRSIQAAAPPGHLLLKQAAIWYSLTVYFGLNYRVGERAPKVCQNLQGFFFKVPSFLSSCSTLLEKAKGMLSELSLLLSCQGLEISAKVIVSVKVIVFSWKPRQSMPMQENHQLAKCSVSQSPALPALGRMWMISGVKASDWFCSFLALKSAAKCMNKARTVQFSEPYAASSSSTSSCWV